MADARLRGLTDVTRRGARNVSSPPIALLLTAAIVFVAVAIDVTHHGLLARIDPHVAHWSYRHVTGVWHDICEVVTHLGDAWLLAVFVLLAAAWLIKAHRRVDAAVLAAAGAATAFITAVLKDAFHRDRPIHVDPVHGPKSFSFPSGHASGAFAVYVLLALLLTAGAGQRIRLPAIGVAVGLASIVAASRMLLPVHFLSDIVAGTAVGLAVVASALLARAASGSRR